MYNETNVNHRNDLGIFYFILLEKYLFYFDRKCHARYSCRNFIFDILKF